jgi:hypothetical protein
VYCGEIEPLGVDAITGRHHDCDAELLKSALFSHDFDDEEIDEFFATEIKEIQDQVAKVVMTTKKKDPADWTRGAQAQNGNFGTGAGTGRVERRPLYVFLGGGGSGSPFYERVILGTHSSRRMQDASIPPFQIVPMPPPPDFDFGTVPSTEYHRFAVAYGLSIPVVEGPEFTPPGQIDDIEKRIVRGARPVGVYVD